MPFIPSNTGFPIRVSYKQVADYERTLPSDRQHDEGQIVAETRLTEWTTLLTVFTYDDQETEQYIHELVHHRPFDHRHRLSTNSTHENAVAQHQRYVDFATRSETYRERETSPTMNDLAHLVNKLNRSNNGRAAIRLASKMLDESLDEKSQDALRTIIDAGSRQPLRDKTRELLRQTIS